MGEKQNDDGFDYRAVPLMFILGPLLIIGAFKEGFSKSWKVDAPIIAGTVFWYSLIIMVAL